MQHENGTISYRTILTLDSTTVNSATTNSTI